MQLPPLYAITDRKLAGRSHPEIVADLVRNGCKLIQLREKELPDKEFLRQAQQAVHIARTAGTLLVIDDRIDIALAARADGVHIGQDDVPPEVARQLLGPERIVGISSHSLEQALLADRAPVDYVAFGPIFASKTKMSSDRPLGLDLLARLRSQVKHSVVAIGGITRANSAAVLAAGASSVAVISELMARPNPGEYYRDWLAQLQQSSNDKWRMTSDEC